VPAGGAAVARSYMLANKVRKGRTTLRRLIGRGNRKGPDQCGSISAGSMDVQCGWGASPCKVDCTEMNDLTLTVICDSICQ